MLDAKNKGSYYRAMNRLDRETRARILHLLCEGQSIRAITRLTGVSKNTVAKLLVSAGHACAAYQDKALRDPPTLSAFFGVVARSILSTALRPSTTRWNGSKESRRRV